MSAWTKHPYPSHWKVCNALGNVYRGGVARIHGERGGMVPIVHSRLIILSAVSMLVLWFFSLHEYWALCGTPDYPDACARRLERELMCPVWVFFVYDTKFSDQREANSFTLKKKTWAGWHSNLHLWVKDCASPMRLSYRFEELRVCRWSSCKVPINRESYHNTWTF